MASLPALVTVLVQGYSLAMNPPEACKLSTSSVT